MNSKQVEAGLLINEWQLGTELNIAVANGSREKFNLLLSLLSADACDFSQFDLPKVNAGDINSVELREYLSLSARQPLVNSGISLQQAEILSISLHKKDMSGVRLQTLLNNEAILSRSDSGNFDRDIVDNLSLLAQSRLDNSHCHQSEQGNDENSGIDHLLMEGYQALNLNHKAVKVHYI